MKPSLTDVPGIGASTAQDLSEGGIRTVEALANASIATIRGIPGFGPTRAGRIKTEAAALLRDSAPAKARTAPAPKAAPAAQLEPELEAATDDLSVAEAAVDDELTEQGMEEEKAIAGDEVTEATKEKKAKKADKGKRDKKKKKDKKDKTDKKAGKTKKDKGDKKAKDRGKKGK